MKEALHDKPMSHEFAGLGMGEDHLPDESTILRLCHLLEAHNLSLQMLATGNATLSAKGLMLKQGTAVDATSITTPRSSTNCAGTAEPEIHQIQKGTQWYN